MKSQQKMMKKGDNQESIVEKEQQEVSIPISGMQCASCVMLVERSLKTIDGVAKVNVNLANEKSYVHFDAEKTNIDELNAAIRKAGFKPLSIEEESDFDEEEKRKQREIRIKWLEFIVSMTCMLPLAYIAMAPMISALPFPTFLAPEMKPLLFTSIQIILLIPIMIAGRSFYINGIKSLITRSLTWTP